MSAFIADCCTVHPTLSVNSVTLYQARKAWDETQGANRRLSQAQFGKQLRAVAPGVRTEQPRGEDGRRRRYVGLELNDYGKSLTETNGGLFHG
jgi:phage/plasmid-associated DNA primase